MGNTNQEIQANPAKQIHALLLHSCERFPKKTAIIHEDRRATYTELKQHAQRISTFLVDSGIIKGDRVILMHENSIEYVAAYYGILMAGAIVVSLNPDTRTEGFKQFFDELAPACIIASTKVVKTIGMIDVFPVSLKYIFFTKPIPRDLSLPLPIHTFEELTQSDACYKTVPIDEDDLAAIIYTSGSSGKPKGVMLTHKNIIANTRSICTYLQLTETDIQMVILPFFYVMGKSLLNTHIASGGTVIINNKFAFPASVVQQMIAENVTGFSGVPSTFAYLLHRSPFAASRDRLSSLRYVSQAGGHMAKQTKLALREALPQHTNIIIMYGATEASARLTWLDPEHFHEKIDSVGKAIPGVTISIIGPHGEKLPPNKIGEITAMGDNIMVGYWKNDSATEQVIDHNGYHTGDMGYQDEDGYIYITGRRDNQLKVSGHRVDPQEIEDTIMESQLLMETAVIGIPDQLMGNKLYALGVPIAGSTSVKDILSFTSGALPHHKVPSTIFFVKSLPKNPNGKIDRSACSKTILKFIDTSE